MWNAMVLMVLISLVGYYTIRDEQIVPDKQAADARNLAASMATYRQAVINYAKTAPAGTVNNASLTLPTGYSLPANLWASYIDVSMDPNGIIYVYPASATSLPPGVDITDEIVKLSQYSVLAGKKVGNSTTLYAPADVAVSPPTPVNPAAYSYSYSPGSAIPLPAGANIPADAPVWLAFRN